MKYILITVVLCFSMLSACNKRPSEDQRKVPIKSKIQTPSKDSKNYLQESSEEKAARMAWWKEARFGMFIHWGLYAIPAGTYKGRQVPFLGEWIMNEASIPVKEYEQLASQFNPVEFDAEEWVKIAEQAGMKYIVITSKHHDGFCLWDSKITDWDIMERTPFRRDILAELAAACKKHDMHLGFYHSIMDWHHPQAQGGFYPKYNDKERVSPEFHEYAENYMKPQIKELLTGYGDIDIMWFDGQWIADWDGDKGRELYNFVRRLKPDIIVNNRVGRDKQEPDTCQEPTLIGDFGTPEQRIPSTGIPGMDWESCLTINNTWGYKSYDHDWKSPELLIRILVDIVSKGGNLLLNVGPTAKGLIPAPSVDRLKDMGEWLAVNGESIYGAQASPFPAPAWGRFTRKDSTIYAHVMAWPSGGKLAMAKPKGSISKIYLLSDKKKTPLSYELTSSGVLIDVPAKAPDPVATVIAVTLQE